MERGLVVAQDLLSLTLRTSSSGVIKNPGLERGFLTLISVFLFARLPIRHFGRGSYNTGLRWTTITGSFSSIGLEFLSQPAKNYQQQS